ncbi:MAG: hypothetical protein FIB07_09635 [Candidatus Methanoperedens sp.]|nr:hypothetical protein [Candidatus Methanoperedens sp.]
MTFLRNSNILLLFILTIVLVYPSAAQESHIFPNSSDFPTRLKNISHIESLRDTITFRPLPNITMGDIHPGRLNNLNNNKNIYLFSWDDIPGNDTVRLITLLRSIFHIEWIKTATIGKTDGGMTIKVSTGNNSLLLKLNDDKTRVYLTINNVRTDEFIVKTNNNKLNIYKNFTGKLAQTGLFSRNNNQSGRIIGNAYFVPEPQMPSVLNISSKKGAVQTQPLGSLKPRANYNNILKSNKSRSRFDVTSLKSKHKPGELLVKYTTKLQKKDFETFYKSQNITFIKDYPSIRYNLIQVDESKLEKTMESLSLSDKFEDAEPNYIVKALKTPNDLRFNELWAMNNTGQTGGTPDADIDAPQAWDISTGNKEVIVAVIDTGVDYTHEDLAANMWTNIGEIPDNGIDDDNNGFADDYYGWDFAYDDNDPMDGNSHGTHVSGTIGGVGNNGKGVAGVLWNTNIMAVKFLGDDGYGWTSDAIDAINYATMMGVDIMSNSWGGGEYSSALEAAIQAADNAGILFVAASGNWAENTDQYPNYPSGYDVPNVISIAATDKNDNLASFSNYGPLTIDIGAPGVDILSSVPGNSYSSYSGTSMAAPHVSGASALLKALNPSLTHLEIKNILMNSVDPLPSLNGKTVTGGRLNIQKAITYRTVCPTGCDYTTIQAAVDGANPGSLISVKNGTYYENVQINKQLTLRGFGSPVVDARGSGSAFTLSEDGIILEGFTATRGAFYPEAGIKIISNNNTLRGNNVSSNALGMVLVSSKNNVIYDNIFNNTENVKIINPNINNWNITKQSRTNIIGGLYLGGNFWAKPDGSGISQNCDDGNLDGICDFAYALDSTNIDYLPFSTRGSIHNINKGTNYTTIQAAINDAHPGDEIRVASRTYYENVNVNKRLILRGVGMPVVDARRSGSSITLSANGSILDGFTVIGGGSTEAGIKVTSNNNTLTGNNASNDYWWGSIGIYLSSSSNNTLSSNNASHNSYGIYLSSSSNNTLSSNNASHNGYGISLYSSNKNVLINNVMNGNSYNFGVEGDSYLYFDNQIDTTNLVDGKSVYYIKGAKDIVYDSYANVGTLYCISCMNLTLKNLDMKNNLNGIFIWNTTQLKIQNVTISNNVYGISMSSSINNTLIDNDASNNWYGIYLYSSNNSNLSSNSANLNYDVGISLFSSSNNTLSGNDASDNKYGGSTGISLSSSSNNTLIGNTASDNGEYSVGTGISLSSSSNNTLIGNNASGNGGWDAGDYYYDYYAYSYGYGISLSFSSNNTLINNNANSNWGRTYEYGEGYGYGIFLSSSSNNTLISNNANSNNGYADPGEGYGFGISLSSSSNNTLIDNTANLNYYYDDYGCNYCGVGTGISLSSSSQTMLVGNNASNNGDYKGTGISLSYSSKSILVNNIMNENNYNFGLGGSSYSDFDNQIDTTNLVDGKSIYYIKGAKNTVYDSDTTVGNFYCISCVNVTLRNLNLKNNMKGIFFWNTTYSKIQNITVSNNRGGISLFSSSNNILVGNNATWNNDDSGIYLYSSSNNTLISNNASSNNGEWWGGTGISLSSSSSNTLIGNNASNNGYYGGTGISLSLSSSNTLIGNNASNNGYYGGIGISFTSSDNSTLIGNNANLNNYAGILMSSSSNNRLSGNNASDNGDYWGGTGILMSYSSNNNTIFNNIFNNLNNVEFWDSNINTWNTTRQSSTNIIGGTNLGGNFWANPEGIGLSQTCEDSNRDDICDSVYTLDSVNIDYLPLSIRKPVHNINKSKHYITIQAAINDANPGNEIQVDSGTYFENMNVTKQLNLRGIGMPVVDARGSGSAITLSADGIRLEGFTVTGAGSNTEAGINVISNNNTVRDNNATSNSQGIFLNSSNFNKITSNNISNSTSFGIRVYDTSTDNIIKGNKVYNSNYGMFFVYAFNTTASDNIMENNSFNFGVGGNLTSHFDGNNIDTTNLANGRHVYYIINGKDTVYGSSMKASTFYCILCNNVTFKDMEISNMDKGVYFWSTSNSRIQNITVKQSGWGIYLRQSPNNSITDSKFSTNNLQNYSERGVTIYSSNDNTLTNNTFILNNYGLELYSSSKNIIYNNYFNNTNNFLFTGTNYVNTWNTTKKPGINIIGGFVLGGNFWANPSGNGFSQTCPDIDRDGICDSKYSFNSNNSDYLPLTYKPPETGIKVVSPNGGENWRRGTTPPIIWDPINKPCAYVKIELLKPGKPIQLIVASTLNDGFHPWLILPTQPPGNDYMVRITCTTNPIITDTSDNYFTIMTPSITVVSPNGGENWTRGTTRIINWTSTESPGSYVKIELLKPGKPNQVIVSSTLNDGSHPWSIPAAQAPGSDYKVKITSTTNPAVNDTSDNNFTILTPSITVASPNGGENLRRGATEIINWSSANNPGGYVKIELLKSGVPKIIIISSTPNDGSHPWMIPPTLSPGSDYKVRITSTTSPAYNDISDNNFTILTPSFTVISPNGGENLRRGTTKIINWTSTESPGSYVKIELFKAGALKSAITTYTLNDGSYPWPIPAALAPGSDYKVKITSTTNASVSDISDNNFTIMAPSITVVSPNDGENWIRGTTKIINWMSTESPGSYVKIELLKPGKPNQVIISSTLNDGSHPWLIPSAQAPGSDYKVKITSTINASNNDISDGNFTIPVPSITVATPNGGENWRRGMTQTIKWTSTESPGTYVKIELLKAGVFNRLIVASTLNDGSHPWLIPATQLPGSDYMIRINSTINPAITDSGNNNFNITG